MQVKIDPISFDLNLEELDAQFREKLRNIPLRGRNGSNDKATMVVAEYYTLAESGEMGRTVFFSNVGNKKNLDFLAGDPRSFGGDLTVYAVDLVDGATTSGLSAATTEAAIDRAMATWDGAICSDILLAKNPVNSDIGVVQAILGFGGDLIFFYGDVQHSGFLPGAFFDILAPGGSGFILGVAFTFVFNVDINGDGVPEVAFRDIYYNDNFPWADGANIDVESVALHEAGHGLSQAHYGKAFGTNSNGKIHFSPKAVMNAGYTGVQTTLLGTDNGGHCSLWANWPNN